MLELKNISFQADDGGKEIEILRNINLTVENRFVAVTGPNRPDDACEDCGRHSDTYGGTDFPGRCRYHGKVHYRAGTDGYRVRLAAAGPV